MFCLKKYKSYVKSQHHCLVLFSWNAVATRENGMQSPGREGGREGRVRWGWGGWRGWRRQVGGIGGVVARTCWKNSCFNSLYCMYKYHKAFLNRRFFPFLILLHENISISVLSDGDSGKVNLSPRHVCKRWRVRNIKKKHYDNFAFKQWIAWAGKKDFIMWRGEGKCYDFIERESPRLRDTDGWALYRSCVFPFPLSGSLHLTLKEKMSR